MLNGVLSVITRNPTKVERVEVSVELSKVSKTSQADTPEALVVG